MTRTGRDMAQPEMTQRPWHGADHSDPQEARGQQVADIKAFTGKGRARRANSLDLVQLEAELSRISESMAILAEHTHKVPGRQFYLAIHRRASNHQTTLRWRSVATRKHLPWSSMPEEFRRQLPQLSKWYCDVNEKALQLNMVELTTRTALRAAVRYQDLLQKSKLAGSAGLLGSIDPYPESEPRQRSLGLTTRRKGD